MYFSICYSNTNECNFMLLTVFYPCLMFVCCIGEYGLWLFIFPANVSS